MTHGIEIDRDGTPYLNIFNLAEAADIVVQALAPDDREADAEITEDDLTGAYALGVQEALALVGLNGSSADDDAQARLALFLEAAIEVYNEKWGS